MVLNNILCNIYKNNFWHFDAGSIMNTEDFLHKSEIGIHSSFIKISKNTGGFPKSFNCVNNIYKNPPDEHYSSLLIQTLINSLHSNQYLEKNIILNINWSLKNFLLEIYNLENKITYLEIVNFLSFLSLQKSKYSEVLSVCSTSVIEVFINKILNNLKLKNILSDFLFLKFYYGICLILGSKYTRKNLHYEIGIDLLNQFFKIYSFDNINTFKGNSGLVKLNTLLKLIDLIVNVSFLHNEKTFIDKPLSFLRSLHRKFEIRKNLFSKTFDLNTFKFSSDIDLASNAHIANLWFIVGFQQNDILLINSAFKMMDILRGVAILSNTRVTGLPQFFPSKNYFYQNNISVLATKYFMDASLTEIKIRKNFS